MLNAMWVRLNPLYPALSQENLVAVGHVRLNIQFCLMLERSCQKINPYCLWNGPSSSRLWRSQTRCGSPMTKRCTTSGSPHSTCSSSWRGLFIFHHGSVEGSLGKYSDLQFSDKRRLVRAWGQHVLEKAWCNYNGKFSLYVIWFMKSCHKCGEQRTIILSSQKK